MEKTFFLNLVDHKRTIRWMRKDYLVEWNRTICWNGTELCGGSEKNYMVDRKRTAWWIGKELHGG